MKNNFVSLRCDSSLLSWWWDTTKASKMLICFVIFVNLLRLWINVDLFLFYVLLFFLLHQNAYQPSHLLEGVFNGILYLRANPWDRLQFQHNNNTWQRLESDRISTRTPKIFFLSTTEFNMEFLQITCLGASIYRLQKPKSSLMRFS